MEESNLEQEQEQDDLLQNLLFLGNSLKNLNFDMTQLVQKLIDETFKGPASHDKNLRLKHRVDSMRKTLDELKPQAVAVLPAPPPLPFPPPPQPTPPAPPRRRQREVYDEQEPCKRRNLSARKAAATEMYPKLGSLPRFCALTQTTYDNCEAVACWAYHIITSYLRNSPELAEFLRESVAWLRENWKRYPGPTAMGEYTLSQAPCVTKLERYISNKYLSCPNLFHAAKLGSPDLMEIGRVRSPDTTEPAPGNATQLRFKNWAIETIRAWLEGIRSDDATKGQKGPTTQRGLLQCFYSLDQEAQLRITPHVPDHYFKSGRSFRLDMATLIEEAKTKRRSRRSYDDDEAGSDDHGDARHPKRRRDSGRYDRGRSSRSGSPRRDGSRRSGSTPRRRESSARRGDGSRFPALPEPAARSSGDEPFDSPGEHLGSAGPAGGAVGRSAGPAGGGRGAGRRSRSESRSSSTSSFSDDFKAECELERRALTDQVLREMLCQRDDRAGWDRRVRMAQGDFGYPLAAGVEDVEAPGGLHRRRGAAEAAGTEAVAAEPRGIHHPAHPPPGQGQPPPSSLWPFEARPPRFAPCGRLLDDELVEPKKRGLSLREMLSALIVRSQYHQQLEHLPAGCFGTAQSIMLQDGEITALYEFAYGFQPGELGPTGRRQPPFCFRLSFLDRPSPAAAGPARMLLAEALAAVGNLDCVCDRVSVVTIFRTMLRKIFDGAGRNPMSEKNGWINVNANPALTGALAAFANYGATVGQSVGYRGVS